MDGGVILASYGYILLEHSKRNVGRRWLVFLVVLLRRCKYSSHCPFIRYSHILLEKSPKTCSVRVGFMPFLVDMGTVAANIKVQVETPPLTLTRSGSPIRFGCLAYSQSQKPGGGPATVVCCERQGFTLET